MKVKEGLRRSRLGDLRRLFRERHGMTLPDSDAGREALRELLLVASMAYNGERMMLGTIAQWAPWLDKAKAAETMDDVNRTQVFLRFPSARVLGNRVRLTDYERHKLAITTIRPFDVTDEQLVERRKAKDARRKWRKRRAAQKKPREAWLANRLTRTQPWKRFGIGRRQWERRSAKERAARMSQVHVAGVSATKLDIGRDALASSESVRGLKRSSRKSVAMRKAGARERKAARG